MAKADFSTPRPLRIGLIVLIALIHVAAFFGLMRAFAPGVVDQAVEKVTSAIFVTITAPTPTPTPPPPPPRASTEREQGAEGAAGKKAKPREETAPEGRIVISEKPAPKASSTGTENRSGASQGEGTGAGNTGSGTGAGGEGSGQGGGIAAKAEKIAGDINSARDYDRKTRDLRLGKSVTVAITVGVDGNPKGCRVVRPSPDDAANRTTCDLAMKRFRFRPATNRAGQPVESVYGWQQRWWDPRQ